MSLKTLFLFQEAVSLIYVIIGKKILLQLSFHADFKSKLIIQVHKT